MNYKAKGVIDLLDKYMRGCRNQEKYQDLKAKRIGYGRYYLTIKDIIVSFRVNDTTYILKPTKYHKAVNSLKETIDKIRTDNSVRYYNQELNELDTPTQHKKYIAKIMKPYIKRFDIPNGIDKNIMAYAKLTKIYGRIDLNIADNIKQLKERLI
jgi:hypothetical protein